MPLYLQCHGDCVLVERTEVGRRRSTAVTDLCTAHTFLPYHSRLDTSVVVSNGYRPTQRDMLTAISSACLIVRHTHAGIITDRAISSESDTIGRVRLSDRLFLL